MSGDISIREAREIVRQFCRKLEIPVPKIEELSDASILDGEFSIVGEKEPVLRFKKRTNISHIAHELIHYLLYLVKIETVLRDINEIERYDNLEERLSFMLEAVLGQYILSNIYKQESKTKSGRKR